MVCSVYGEPTREKSSPNSADVQPKMKRREPLILFFVGAIALVISGWSPLERGTWWLEVFPIFLGVPLLIATHRRFPLTPLAYRLIFIHALILMLGGHYTYAKVPLGFWMEKAFGFVRNDYDRIGHFAQGFVPAMVAREVLLRVTPLARGKMLTFLVFSVCMAISAMYELFEFAAAKITGTAADAFLGSQGDVWDTQWDMTFCLIGATCALLFFSGVQDRALSKLKLRMDKLPY